MLKRIGHKAIIFLQERFALILMAVIRAKTRIPLMTNCLDLQQMQKKVVSERHTMHAKEGVCLRSCLEFISEDIQQIFPGILFHLLRSLSELWTKKIGQKGGNRPQIGPK